MADIDLIVGYESVKRANQEINQIGSNAQRSASAFERAFRKTDQEARKNLKTLQDQMALSRRFENQRLKELNGWGTAQRRRMAMMEESARIAKRQADEEAKAAQRAALTQKEHADQIEQLRLKFLPAYAASKRYEQQLEQLNKAKREGIITGKQYDVVLEQINNEYQRAAIAANGANNAFATSTRGINRFGVMTQQTGYQVGDFLVQVQSGTNWMVAFGQQATQVVGTMTLLGGKWLWIGSALGIIIPLVTALGAAWMRAGGDAEESARTFEDAIGSIDSLSSDLSRTQDILEMSAQELVSTYGEYAQSIRDAASALAELQVAETRANLGQSFQELSEALDRFIPRASAGIFDFGVTTYQAAQNIREAFGTVGADTARLQEGFRELSNALTLDERISALQDLYTTIVDLGISIDELPDSFRQALIQANQLAIKTAEVATNMRDAASAAVGMTTGVPLFNQPGFMLNLLPPPPSSRRTGRGGGRSLEPLSDYLDSLREEATFRRSLVGVSEEQVTQMERERQLRDMIAQATGVELELGDSRLQQLVQMEAQTRQLMQREQQRMALQRSFEQTIENGLMSMVEGAASVEDAFKGMIRNILIQIVRQQFMEPLSKNIASGIMGLFGFANGGAFSGGRVLPFANGGIVSSPTMFPMRGGTGLMGEAGPEAIMPLKRTSSGKLGVVAEGNGSVVVNQTFQFQANGDESVKRIIAESAPKIAQMTQKQLLDSRRRGGTMKAAFR